MKVRAIFEFTYPDDELAIKVHSKAHEMYVALDRVADRIQEYRREDDNPEFVIESIDAMVKQILKEIG